MNDRVGRVHDDLIVGIEAGDDLDLIAEIVPSRYCGKHDLPVLHNADM